MSRLGRFWPLPAVVAAAALAFAGYTALRPDDAGNGRLRHALALLDEPGRTQQAMSVLEQAGQHGSTGARSQADNLLASLVFELRGGKASAQAMRLYAKAVRLDATDEASKFDLELLLTMGGQKQHGKSNDNGRAHGKKKTTKIPKHDLPGGGAGANAGGEGY